MSLSPSQYAAKQRVEAAGGVFIDPSVYLAGRRPARRPRKRLTPSQLAAKQRVEALGGKFVPPAVYLKQRRKRQQ